MNTARAVIGCPLHTRVDRAMKTATTEYEHSSIWTAAKIALLSRMVYISFLKKEREKN